MRILLCREDFKGNVGPNFSSPFLKIQGDSGIRVNLKCSLSCEIRDAEFFWNSFPEYTSVTSKVPYV